MEYVEASGAMIASLLVGHFVVRVALMVFSTFLNALASRYRDLGFPGSGGQVV